MDSAVLAARFCDGGHDVNGEDSVRLPPTLREPPSVKTPARRRLPLTPEGRARLIGGGLGLAGAIYIAGAVLRYLGVF